MSREINFVAEQRRSLTKTEVSDRRVMRIALIVFGVITGVFVIVFGVNWYQSSQLRALAQAQQTALAQITANEQTERSFVVFVNKLKSLTSIARDRQEKNDAIEFFSSVFGQDAFLRKIEFNQQDKIVTFRVQVDDVFALQRVFQTLESDAVQEKFATVSTSNLLRLSNGRYEVNVTVSTGKDVAAVPVPGPAGGKL